MAGGIEHVKQGDLVVDYALLAVGIWIARGQVSDAILIARCGEGKDEPSIVGSYSSTKWLWINWMVRQDFPTPPPPTTTSLYSRRN